MDINQNRPASVNPISNEKNAVPKSTDILSGFFAGSMNAGHDVTVNCFPVMAGEQHKQYNQQMRIKLLTPLTAPYQNAYLTLKAYFVPDVRVWANAEEFYAQNKGSADIKITELPNIGGKQVFALEDESSQGDYTNLMNTTLWRNAFISSYIPRIGHMERVQTENPATYLMPKMSVLPLRGRVAIYNDFLRHKEYDEKVTEYRNSNTVSNTEWESYLPRLEKDLDYYNGRSKRPDNYYTNYRTDMQGFETAFPPEDMSSDRALVTWMQWEQRYAETVSEASNVNMNVWDVIAKIRGSRVAEEGKVQLIGENTITLNYAAVTQNAYNTSDQIRPEFKTLGQQGAYSYTEAVIPVYAGFMPNEEGHIHIIANVWVDTVYEKGIDRRWLNVNALDQYRPDMKNDKFDVLYAIETGLSEPATPENGLEDFYNIAVGFKRRWSEYFKLSNCIRGDLTTKGYYEINIANGTQFLSDFEILSQNSYQFFEEERAIYEDFNGIVHEKKPWKDYSDLLINKNQAIMNEIESTPNGVILIRGHHQIDFVGRAYLEATIPVDPAIKNNYTTWGEH